MDAIEPFEPAANAAINAVVRRERNATDAWLEYVRTEHPAAAEELARAAMTYIAVDLLIANGDLSREEGTRQRLDAAFTASAVVDESVWKALIWLREILDMLEAQVASPDVIDLDEAAYSSSTAAG